MAARDSCRDDLWLDHPLYLESRALCTTAPGVSQIHPTSTDSHEPLRGMAHCVSERQARTVWAALSERMAEVGLRLHPDKTKIVYCRDDNRPGSYEHTSFTFLGYEFRPRSVRSKHGEMFTAFAPAISKQALRDISREVRRWRIHTRTRHDLSGLADLINPIVRGWMQYYGRFHGSLLLPLLRRINGYLVRWARRKYRRLWSFQRVKAWWERLVRTYPRGFAHWQWATGFVWIR